MKRNRPITRKSTKKQIIDHIFNSELRSTNQKSFLDSLENTSTEDFLYGVIKRVSPIIDLSLVITKMKDNKMKQNQKLENNNIGAINLENPDVEVDLSFFHKEPLIKIDLTEEEVEEIKIISKKEFCENVAKATENKTENPAAFTCYICYRTKVLINTRQFICGHEFCNKCATKWMKVKSTCPICRKSLYKFN